MTASAPTDLIVHASCVAYDGKAVLITGASGRGKSTLALELMAYGAVLVSDDQTVLRRDGSGLVASAPATIRGQIEARGVGILNADVAKDATVTLVVDLDHVEETRLPPRRSIAYAKVNLPLIFMTGAPGFAAAVFQHLKAGRSA